MTVTVIGDNTGDDYAGTEDTHLQEGTPTVTHETDDPLQVTKWNTNDYHHVLLSFSGLSNISSGDTVSAATLAVYWVSTNVPAAEVADVRRVLRNWVVSQATWNDYATSSAWTTGGGISDGNDRSATIAGTIPMDATGYFSTSAANLVTLVKNWVDLTWANYGVHIERNAGSPFFKSSTLRAEDGTDGQRPYLSVTHAAAGGVANPWYHNAQMQL